MNIYLKLIDDIRIHIISLFDKHQTNELWYHNLEHTKIVVQKTSEIAANYDLSEYRLIYFISCGMVS